MSAISSALEQALGSFAVLYVAPPGLGKRPMGVVVWDRKSDSIYLTQRSLQIDPADDLSLVWDGLGDMLDGLARTEGGFRALEWLESTASHVIQIGTPEPIGFSGSEDVGWRLFGQVASLEASRVHFSLEQINDTKSRIPITPSVAVQALTALNSQHASRAQIEVAVSRDPALVGKVIQASNSGAIHLREPARNLSAALQRLGFDSVRILVVGLTVGRAFTPAGLRRVWEHCIETAQLAKSIAPSVNLSTAESALAALLHDVGKVSLYSLGDEYLKEYDRLQSTGLPDVLIEREIVGKSHADLGAELLEDWGFPVDLCDAVRHHHSPSLSSSKLSSLLMLCESDMSANEDCWSIRERRFAEREIGFHRAKKVASSHVLDPDLAFLKASA